MIHILPPEIANRIAAGEVVERPASVVRELIDNAIDAGARRIDVEIEQGGLQSIRVIDDGCGMTPEDAALCSKRHATSKIRTAEDLNAITTMGFRGEALAAISSVARFELKTRTPDSEWGIQILIEGGQEKAPERVGTSVGTTVTIRDLFYNTPARRKFLKKPATEMNHVLSTVSWNALAHENIHFTFSHNGRRSLDLPAVTSRAERIQQLFGKQVLDELIPVGLDTPVLSLSGFISRPTLTRNGAQHIFFFVNDRYIRDRLLHRALMNGYRNLIHAGRFPVVFLYLEINPAEIDINVHPTKQEIKFSREDAVFSATYGAIRQAWETGRTETGIQPELGSDLEPNLDEAAEPVRMKPVTQAHSEPCHSDAEFLSIPQKITSPDVHKPVVIQQLNREIPALRPADFSVGRENLPPNFTQEERDSVEISENPPSSSGKDAAVPFSFSSQDTESREEKNPLEKIPSLPLGAIRDLIHAEKKGETLFDVRSLEESGELTVLGQLMNSYILAEGKEGLFIIDQHAAHERLLFEQLLNQSQNAPLASQALLFPITLDFAPDEVGLVEEISGLLRSLGFSIEPFGGHTFVVRSIPSNLGIDESEQFIKDFLGEVRYEGNASEYKEKALHTLACRAAVKFGDQLSVPEMEGILRGLEKIPRRNVCPHGRPAILFIAEAALQKAFKRTGF